MKEQDLEIIKNRTLVLKQGERSSELKLVDPEGGDMYLVFELKYIKSNEHGTTQITPTDPYHASVVIETLPNSITEPEDYIKIGTYGDGAPLYLGFVVQPQIAQSGQHNVIVTFYKEKEGRYGSDNN